VEGCLSRSVKRIFVLSDSQSHFRFGWALWYGTSLGCMHFISHDSPLRSSTNGFITVPVSSVTHASIIPSHVDLTSRATVLLTSLKAEICLSRSAIATTSFR
jgi:hypothetical protein